MSSVLITGSHGLIGSECVSFFTDKFDEVIGVDNDMRRYFFGDSASTHDVGKRLCDQYGNYKPFSVDVRFFNSLEFLFKSLKDVKLIIHTAAQPSHDWATSEPITDWTVNATGTMNMLELTRQYFHDAVFIFTSTNKVYGDWPNKILYEELEKRYETHLDGVDELMDIDDTMHSVFGASKVAGDIMCQEYGKYFGMKTGIFRGGCLTGANHKGVRQHGFLSYLVKCAMTGEKYIIEGYSGKQVRDNIHAYDLVSAFYEFYKNPKKGEVYNIGGGRHSNCSILEAIDLIKEITGKELNYTISDQVRAGDHRWYISNVSKFKKDFPDWDYKYSLTDIISQIANQY